MNFPISLEKFLLIKEGYILTVNLVVQLNFIFRKKE